MDSTQLWTLTDGNAGNRRQADALAAALARGPVTDWMLEPEAPWRWCAPRALPGATAAFGPSFTLALAQPPGLAIGCGRQGALATRLLRERGSKAVQILDPRIDTHHWDLVIAPEHDGLSGDNVITLLGSLNPVDTLWLAQARAAFASFADLPRPRTAVLLGGPSAHARFDIATFEALARQLDAALASDGGSLMATTSRRTPMDVVAALRQRYVDTPNVVWCGDADGINPYPGMLAWADRIVATPDSVNMLSEACATDAPVFVFDPDRVSGRPRRFLDALLASGRIGPIDTTLARFPVEPLRETARVAALVKQRLALE
jgi:mitochondrial fission protein ELM1